MEASDNIFEINEVVISFDDFKEYSKSMSLNAIIKVWRGIGVGYVALFGLVLLLLSLSGEKSSFINQSQNILSWDFMSGLFGFLLMFFILIIVPWFIYPQIFNKSLKKTYENNKFMRKPQKYLFGNNGLKVESENGESRYTWDDICIAKETKVYLALYISKYQAFVIPRKYLKGKSDLVDFAKDKLGKRYLVIKNGLIY